jgi:hypothetical protein
MEIVGGIKYVIYLWERKKLFLITQGVTLSHPLSGAKVATLSADLLKN